MVTEGHVKSHTINSKNCYKKKLLSSRLRLVGLRESGVVELAQPSLQFSYNGNAKSVKQCEDQRLTENIKR